MKIVPSGRQDVLEMRGGGGLLMLFGIPFLAAGLFVIASGLGLLPGKDHMPALIAVPFGGIFALAGSLIVFGRRGCTMDRSRGVIQYWSGLLAPMFRKTHRIEDIQQVTLTKEVRRSDRSSYTVYPVRLLGDGIKLEIGETQRYEKSRRLAEQLAEFLSLPLADSSSGEVVIREPEDLNTPLRERLVREGEEPLPEPPAHLESRILRRGNAVRIEIPPARGGIGSLLSKIIFIFSTFFTLVFLGIIGSTIYQWGKTNPHIFWIVGGVAVAFIIGDILILRKFLPLFGAAPTRITVTPEELRVEHKVGLAGLTTEVIPAGELEELILPKADPAKALEVPEMLAGLVAAPIIARSDRKTIQFAGRLSQEEKEFLVAVIKHTLASR